MRGPKLVQLLLRDAAVIVRCSICAIMDVSQCKCCAVPRDTGYGARNTLYPPTSGFVGDTAPPGFGSHFTYCCRWSCHFLLRAGGLAVLVNQRLRACLTQPAVALAQALRLCLADVVLTVGIVLCGHVSIVVG